MPVSERARPIGCGAEIWCRLGGLFRTDSTRADPG
jgi:hypothetical protein